MCGSFAFLEACRREDRPLQLLSGNSLTFLGSLIGQTLAKPIFPRYEGPPFQIPKQLWGHCQLMRRQPAPLMDTLNIQFRTSWIGPLR